MNKNKRLPCILCILDGWGIAGPSNDNAIALAKPPHYQRFLREYSHSQLSASGGDVGLPAGQMGNSEVGHTTIGAGRVVLQELPRISLAIKQKTFAGQPQFGQFLSEIHPGATIHLIGLCSDGGVHSHIDHIIGFAQYCQSQGFKIALHLFTDGRDTPPQSALTYLDILHQQQLYTHIATINGRYYGMDRDTNWGRTQLAFESLAFGRGTHYADPKGAVLEQYGQNIHDEFFKPMIFNEFQGIGGRDAIFMMNFRADRMRQICQALGDVSFAHFARGAFQPNHPKLALVEYSTDIAPYFPPLFTKDNIKDSLGEVIEKHELRQLRLAETEKYAHVTFFMNGGEERVFKGEERILVPSPKVKTYDMQPQMAAPAITQKLLESLAGGQIDVVIMNYANADMVGHTGNLAAAKQAVLAIDTALGQIEDFLRKNQGIMLITADHGNIEDMHDDEHDQANTAHSTNLVPLILVDPHHVVKTQLSNGTLADIAPTILHILGLPIPLAMNGRVLCQ